MCKNQKYASPVIQSSSPVQWMDTPILKPPLLLDVRNMVIPPYWYTAQPYGIYMYTL